MTSITFYFRLFVLNNKLTHVGIAICVVFSLLNYSIFNCLSLTNYYIKKSCCSYRYYIENILLNTSKVIVLTIYNYEAAEFKSAFSAFSLISRMLQRQPETRASLEDIIRDPWLNEPGSPQQQVTDDSSPTWIDELFPDEVILPLAAREHLSEEDHSSILQRMVNGAIAHRDDIIE